MEYARALSALTPTTLGLFDLHSGREMDGALEIRTFSIRHFDQRRGFPITGETWRALGAFDVIHSQVFPTPLTDLLVVLGRLRGQTVVLTDVGGGGPCWSTYLERVHPGLSLNRRAHGLALLSRYASELFTHWPLPSTVLGGGVNLTGVVPGGKPEGYALFVGRLLPHKGVLQLIQALGPTTPLRVVGRPYDAEYVARLRSAAEGKRVEFIFDADDAELARQYAGANVVLQPSLPSAEAVDKSELLGLVALEAMAWGKPVVVTRTTSLPDSVVDGETGFVVEPYDLSAMRERTELLVGNPQLSARMGRAGRAHIEANFTWDRVARRGLAFYEELAGSRRGDGRVSA